MVRGSIHDMLSLRFPDYTIYCADNGLEGLELFKKHFPPVVITDIHMPQMNGIEMAEDIKIIDPHVIYIVLTAYTDLKFVEKFTRIGYYRYLLKPLNFDELFAAVEHCVARSTSRKALQQQ